MIQIVLTPDQIRQIREATEAEAIELVNDRVQVFAHLPRVGMRPDSARDSDAESYSSIAELIEDLGEWDEAEVQRRLDNFQSAGTLSDSLAMLPLENTKSGFARWRGERE